MHYTVILLDVDGTLLNSEPAVLGSLAAALKEMGKPAPDPRLQDIAMYGTSEQAMREIGFENPMDGLKIWNRHWEQYRQRTKLFDGVAEALQALHKMGCRLGVVTSRTRYEYDTDAALDPVRALFEVCVCAEDAAKVKPAPDPILAALEKLGADKKDALYVGDGPHDSACAANAGVDFALALWGCRPGADIQAKHRLVRPDDLVGLARERDLRWLDWARELQALAQTGIHYTKDPYDRDRFTRVRQIAAEMMAAGTNMPLEQVTGLFCAGSGYPTPKLDTRAAVFEGDRILLVQERGGRWALPGGWCDDNMSIADNALKELREEAGLEGEVVKLIAMLERSRHNRPLYAYGVITAFVLVRPIGGAFQENIETVQRRAFPLDQLPPLAEEKTTAETIRMCFAARRSDWQTIVE